MKLTRRNLFRSGAVAGGVAAAGAVPAAVEGARQRHATASLVPVATAATAGSTLVKNPVVPNAGGYRTVIPGPAEPHVVRQDLATANPGRTPVAMVAFAQLSDVHVVDAQSPLRLEFSDRLDDPPLPQTLFSSAYRAHEMLSGHIADAMVRQINDIGAGPVTGRPLDLAIQTGDNSDNSQLNEVRWNIQILNGVNNVRIDSGGLGQYQGVADANPTYYDPAYYHPHGTPPGKVDDVYRKRYGFPVVPGLLNQARAPFDAEGLDMPWFACFGNHDGLVQGNFPQNLQLSLLSTGALKIMSPPAGLSPAELINSLMSGDILGIVQSLALTPSVRVVTPDTNRRLLTRKQVVEQHFVNGDGHGFTTENRSQGHGVLHRSTAATTSGSSCSTRSTPTATRTARSTRPSSPGCRAS